VSESGLPVHVELFEPRAHGHRDTFVLVHGYGASGFTWRHWTPRLAELGRVVQIDLKGFGRAPKPDDGAYAAHDQAELVHRLIEERDLRDVTLVGHSLGGGVALLLSLRLLDSDPARLKRLVLVSGAAYAQRLPPFVHLARWPRLSTLLFRAAGARLVVAAALRSVVYDRSTVSAEQIRGYAEPLASRDAVRVLLAAARQIVPPDLAMITPRYAEVAVPTLLLWGRHDPAVPLAVGRRLERELPRAQLHVLDACGHLPVEERPDASFQVLRRFLEETA
jgi:pimeloyl-ACP methyl ester carboxylesterase